jgi:2'-5' RNA ligase
VFAVELFFDPPGEARVRGLWARLQAAGLPSRLLAEGHMPHVSLAVCDELDPGPFALELERFAVGEQPLDLSLVSVSTFATAEGVLFLGAVKTRALLELHERFFPRFAKAARRPWGYYRPQQWVPHCTLDIGLAPAQLAAALPICVGAGLPIEVVAESVALVEPRRAKVLARFPFAGR